MPTAIQNRLAMAAMTMDYGNPTVNVPSKVRYSTTAMVAIYRRPEILDTDPYGIFRVIYSVHPFLPLWGPKPHGKSRQAAMPVPRS
jgi:hypothetical protein